MLTSHCFIDFSLIFKGADEEEEGGRTPPLIIDAEEQEKIQRQGSFILTFTEQLLLQWIFGVYGVEQGSQTRGLRAACGPPDVFMRPASSSKFP